jgi:CheY-like chemotaxis protein
MPEMDGLALIKNLREEQIRTPIVVCTADQQTSTKEEAISMCAQGVLNKPDLYDSAKAEEVIEQYLSA